MSLSWNSFVAALLALSVPTLLFGMISPAAAGDFYPFSAADDNAMVLIEPEQILVLSDGHRMVALHIVSVDDLGPGAPALAVSLDTTTVELDCTAPRWKVVSEYVYFSLSPTARKIDKTRTNLRDWQNLEAGGLAQRYRSFACGWPTLADPAQLKASFPDLWAAANRAASVIAEEIQNSAKH